MKLKSTPKISLLMAAVAVMSLWGGPATAAGEVNLYSFRQPFLMEPLFTRFSETTGIKVNAVYAKSGLLQRLKAEGANSPADAVLASDVTRIDEIAAAGLLGAVNSSALNANVPQHLRHPEGLWFGLTTRARVIFAHKVRIRPGEVTSYEDLAAPHMQGRVCMRSGKHEYNISLLASIIAAKGEAEAMNWLTGLKNNLARRPQGNDRAQVKAVFQGECDVALGNTYYMGKMQTNDKEPEQKDWAAAVNVIFPNQGGRGTHINISGAGITKFSKNRENAIRLIEFLSGAEAQKIYAEDNFEYPVKPGVAWHPLVAGWGSFKPDETPLASIIKNRTLATMMMDRVRFDH